jgi:hypothetical protein
MRTALISILVLFAIAMACCGITHDAEIEQIKAADKVQIDKLKELRKTLINDIVTGKIKVA